MLKGFPIEFLREDLALAGQLQRSFLPVPEERPGMRVVAEYRPAFDIGGDFYDVIYLPDGRVTLLIGDVAGKGVAAALLMARISVEFRRLGGEKLSPKRMLERVDQWMTSQGLTDRFVTATCVQLQPARARWVASNAGHIVPLLRRANGEVLRLSEPSGLPLGLSNVAAGADPFIENEVAAVPGDIVLLTTDGIVEAFGHADGDPAQVGAHVAELLAAGPADVENLRQRIFAVVERTHSRRDDATLLALALAEEAFAEPVARPGAG